MSKRKKPSTPVPEEVRKYPGKKDKKKWCKGKVGIEHDYEWHYIPKWVGYRNELWSWDFKHECKKCGRRDDSSAFHTFAVSVRDQCYIGDPVSLVLQILNGKLKIKAKERY